VCARETLLAQEDFAGARGLQERVLKARLRVLKEDHPDTFASMNNLAETLLAQEDFAGARGLQECVLAVYRRVLGDRQEASTMSAVALIFTLLKSGDTQAATGVATDALRWMRDADPTELTADQRAIRRQLKDVGAI